jgi:hypothetical protein
MPTEPVKYEWSADLLFAYFTAQIEGIRREVEVASTEREKAAQALGRERERVADAVTREREDAADALAVALGERIATGDANLRQHIDAQKETIVQMINAADKAVSKAEESMNSRLEGMNEFRAQLSHQASTFLPREIFDSYTNQMEKLGGDMLQKETYETNLSEWTKWRQGVEERASGLMIRTSFDAFYSEYITTRETLLRKDRFEALNKDFTEWRRGVDREITTTKARNAAYAAGVGFLVIVVNLGLFIAGHVH